MEIGSTLHNVTGTIPERKASCEVPRRGKFLNQAVRVFRCDEHSGNLMKMNHVVPCLSHLPWMLVALNCGVFAFVHACWPSHSVLLVEFISRTERGNLRAGVVKHWVSEVDDIRSEWTLLSESLNQTDLGESDPWVHASALFGAVSWVPWFKKCTYYIRHQHPSLIIENYHKNC